jgi:F-type H+-transporting ATPase subunit b
MNINLTLLGQMITFAIFIWVTMKFIWPNLIKALNDREDKIINGLQAAEKGQQNLAIAEEFAKRKENETKQNCFRMIAEAKKQAEHIIEAAIIQANIKKEEIIMDGNRELEQNRLKVMQELKEKLAKLIIIGAQQIIEQRLDQTEHQRILLELSNKLYGTP